MAKKITQDEKLDFDIEEVRQEEGPVTCLGKTFANDAERRQYFRDELRKKLPELRHIEGFPIGEDDDIIALSDPPYYTACPNPWLNDFIQEWEEEKKELVKQSKRDEEKIVTEPYAADVSEGKNNPIYNAHSYHTKVPHLAIMRYLMHYTEPGDIIFDGFCGTGMTGVAASLCDSSEYDLISGDNTKKGARRAICSDLAPAATSIAATYNSSLAVSAFKNRALEILKKVEDECGWMYKTDHATGVFGEIQSVVWTDVFICPNCGDEIVFYRDAFDEVKNKLKDDIVCPHCGTKHTKKSLSHTQETIYDDLLGHTVSMSKMVPVKVKYKIQGKQYLKDVSKFDLELIDKISKLPIPYWCPLKELEEGYNTQQPIRTNGIRYIHQFYTRRNLYILASIFDKIGDDKELRLWFTSQLVNVSKLNRYRPEVSFPYNPLNGTLYISSQICEANIFEAYRNKINRFVSAFSLLNHDNVVSVMSATSLSIKNDSIDYMFVDPPFGANIMYSDLNSIWEGWLSVRTNNKEEAIINSAQNKDLFDYQRLMNASLREFYRVLKPGKWLTMEFSNTSASVWNSIQNALQGVGFVVVNVAALDKQQGSFKAVTSTTAVKQDLIITCYKPTEQLTQRFESAKDAGIYVWDFIEDLLHHLPVHIIKEQKTTAVIERNPKILYDRLISYYVQHGYAIPMNAQEFQKGLRERFVERDGMFFTAEQAIQYEEKRAKSDGVVAMGILVSSEAEGIQWLRNHLQDGPKTYQQLQPDWMQDQVAAKKGDQIPELRTILDENFIKDEDGAWHIPNPEKEADLEQIRNKRLQREFDLYVEQAQKPKAKIKEARLEALRYGFKECYRNKDFQSIVTVAARIPESLLMEDEILLQYYDIAASRVK